MLPDSLPQLLSVYRDGLLSDTVPFWMEHAVDQEYGGYFNALDRDGTVLQTDKAVWIQARFAWLLATLYSTVEPRPEWLELARQGIDFLNAHCFDSDGRMFFSVTREGKPLRKRRYLFSECFAVIALAASPETGILLATTQAGLLRSTDDATTWETLSPPEAAVLVAWADDETVVALTVTGRLALSEDGGRTWTQGPQSIGQASTLWAERGANGVVEVIAVVDGTVIATTDDGGSTQILAR